MKGLVLNALGAGLPAVLLCACFEADITPKPVALGSTDVEEAGAKADLEPMPAATDECAEDERLGSRCSVGEGECQQQGEYVCEKGKVICDASPLASEGGMERCGAAADEGCDEECGGASDGGMLDGDMELVEQAADSMGDHDAGLVEMPVESMPGDQFPDWEPTLCEASSDDCACVRGVCLPSDCDDYDPALFVYGVLVNAETPPTGASICYRTCNAMSDCPSELPVCVEERQIWPDDSARSKGCFAK